MRRRRQRGPGDPHRRGHGLLHGDPARARARLRFGIALPLWLLGCLRAFFEGFARTPRKAERQRSDLEGGGESARRPRPATCTRSSTVWRPWPGRRQRSRPPSTRRSSKKPRGLRALLPKRNSSSRKPNLQISANIPLSFFSKIDKVLSQFLIHDC